MAFGMVLSDAHKMYLFVCTLQSAHSSVGTARSTVRFYLSPPVGQSAGELFKTCPEARDPDPDVSQWPRVLGLVTPLAALGLSSMLRRANPALGAGDPAAETLGLEGT